MTELPLHSRRRRALQRAAAAFALELGAPLGDSPNHLVLAATAPDRDRVMKWHAAEANANLEQVGLSLLEGAALAPACDRSGSVLVVDRVRPGFSMTDAWRASAGVPGHVERVSATLVLACELADAVQSLTPRRVSRRALDLIRGDLAGGAAGRILAGDESYPISPDLAADVLARLAGDSPVAGLCHGDFQPGNLLWDGSHWVVIDPRPVVGPPGVDRGRMAVAAVLYAHLDADRVLGLLGDAPGTQAWTRAWALQVWSYIWGLGAGESAAAHACLDLVAATYHGR